MGPTNRPWHCTCNLINMPNLCRKISGFFRSTGVKIPVFPLTLLVIVTAVLRYRATCDDENYQMRYTMRSILKVANRLRSNIVINSFVLFSNHNANYSYWKYTMTSATLSTRVTRLHPDRVSVVCTFGDVVWLQTAGSFGLHGRSSVRAVRWRDRRAHSRSWRESNSGYWLWITQTYVFVFSNSTIYCCNVPSTMAQNIIV